MQTKPLSHNGNGRPLANEDDRQRALELQGGRFIDLVHFVVDARVAREEIIQLRAKIRGLEENAQFLLRENERLESIRTNRPMDLAGGLGKPKR